MKDMMDYSDFMADRNVRLIAIKKAHIQCGF